MITVQHKFIHTTPRKIRLILDSVRGLPVKSAETRLHLMVKQSARDVYAALHASIAAAHDRGLSSDTWIVTRAVCDEGPRLKRRIFASRGRARPIQKQMSHIKISIGPKTQPDAVAKSSIKRVTKSKKDQ